MADSRFPNWKRIYIEQPRESMPWFNPGLDADLEDELTKRKIVSGTFLDLGTGPGTQAANLEKKRDDCLGC